VEHSPNLETDQTNAMRKMLQAMQRMKGIETKCNRASSSLWLRSQTHSMSSAADL
jgi:hypothetical protein